jgi:hypothetical protein
MGLLDDALNDLGLDDSVPPVETKPESIIPAAFRTKLPAPGYNVVVDNIEENPLNDYDNNESEIDQQMSEAERRLSKALLYKQWIGGSLFDGDSTDLTREVESEIGAFVKERLGVLLGCTTVKPAQPEIPVEAQFTPLEVKLLKLLTNHMASIPKVKNFINRETPVTPVQPPIAKPVPVKPTIRPRQQPEAAKTAQRAPNPKPVQKPWIKTPAKKDILPQDNEIFQEGNKKYKAKWAPMNPEEFGPGVEAKLGELSPGQHVTLPKTGQGGGIQIYKASETDYFKVLRLDITPQVRNATSGGVPMPTSSASMAAATAMSAGAALATLSPGAQATVNQVVSAVQANQKDQQE